MMIPRSRVCNCLSHVFPSYYLCVRDIERDVKNNSIQRFSDIKRVLFVYCTSTYNLVIFEKKINV